MFLVYQSEALLNLDKPDDAISLLDKATSVMTNTTIKDFYRIKLSLMMIDNSKELTKQQGLAVLQLISDDTKSCANETALYYLGAFYWSEKKFLEAKNYWQKLIVKYGTQTKHVQSAYSEIVRTKLALLNVESL